MTSQGPVGDTLDVFRQMTDVNMYSLVKPHRSAGGNLFDFLKMKQCQESGAYVNKSCMGLKPKPAELAPGAIV